MLSNDILYQVLLFSNAQDVTSIACVSKTWNSVIKEVEQEIFRSKFCQDYQHLANLIEIVPTTNRNFCWKEALKIQVAPTEHPVGLKQKLQKDLETVFRPRGIAAFLNCCDTCSSSYNEDSSFQIRQEPGIYLFRLYLNAMNYPPDEYGIHVLLPTNRHEGGLLYGSIECAYENVEFLHENWEIESKVVVQFCAVLGLKEGEYTVLKPQTILRAVRINLKESFMLEGFSDTSSEASEDEEMDYSSEEGEIDFF